MWKKMLAVSACLALVTLGVAISQGEDAADPQVDVLIEAQAEVTPTVELFDVTAAAPAGVQFVQPIVAAEAEVLFEPAEVQLADVEAEVVVDVHEAELEQPALGLVKTLRTRVGGPPGIADQATRKAVEALIAGLKAELEALEKAGKTNELEPKRQAIRALELALSGGPARGIAFTRADVTPKLHGLRVVRANAATQEVQAKLEKLHAELAEINATLAGDEAQKRQAEITAKMDQLKKELAEKHGDHIGFRGKLAGAHFRQMTPGIPARMQVQGIPGHAQAFVFQQHVAARHAELEALRKKAEALQLAAEKLKEAGLGDQAREMAEQSDKVRREAEELRVASQKQAEQAQQQIVEFQHLAHGAPPHVIALHGGHAGELHKTLNEVREQVQALRKEVAQLRELLEKNQ